MSTINKTEKKLNTPPGQLFVTNGGSEGEVNIQWDAVKNASRYIIQVSKNGTGWQHIDIVSDPQYTLNGLRTGCIYGFRFCAVFQSGQGSWSEPVHKKVK